VPVDRVGELVGAPRDRLVGVAEHHVAGRGQVEAVLMAKPVELDEASAAVAAEALADGRAREEGPAEAGPLGLRQGRHDEGTGTPRQDAPDEAAEEGDGWARDNGFEPLQVVRDTVGAARREVELQPAGEGCEQ